MQKKKLFNETDKPKNNKHSGEVNLQPKLSHVVQHAEKGIQHEAEPTNTSQEKECKAPAIPKTKFTTKKSESFCVSSSRLKSFPAEEIRRIQPSPKPEPNSNYQQKSGQGDGFLQSLYSEASKFPDKSFLMNQQHLPSTKYKPTPPEGSSFYQKEDKQIHRPFVPLLRGLNLQEPHFVPANHTDNFPPSNHSIEKKEMLASNNRSNLEALKSSMNDFNQIKYQKEPKSRNFMLQPVPHVETRPEPSPQYKIPQELQQQSFLRKIPAQISAHHPPDYFQPINYEPNYEQAFLPEVSHQDLMINRLKISENNQQSSPYNYSDAPKQFPDSEAKLEDKNPVKISTAQQFEYHEYPPRKLPGSQSKEIKKKIIQFTPAMKHDQELLISKLRQQGISEEIIKRQFEALLTEQKRQLNYLQQLAHQENVNKSNKVVARRKISRNSEDGKPEWMAHITPPRITWATADKIKSSQNFTKQQQKKVVEFNDKLDINKGSEQTIQYWQANDRQNGMYVNSRNDHQHWHGVPSSENHPCNCHQHNAAQYLQYSNQQQKNFPINSGHFNNHKKYPEINPLGNGFFILYDPNYRDRFQEEIVTFKPNHLPYPHDYYNYQESDVGNHQNLMGNANLEQLHQDHKFEMSENSQEVNLNEKVKESVVENSDPVKFYHSGSLAGKNGRNNGLQDL